MFRWEPRDHKRKEKEKLSHHVYFVRVVHTFEIVKAGDQFSLRMSKQIPPLLLILQWYILVVNVTFGGLNG